MKQKREGQMKQKGKRQPVKRTLASLEKQIEEMDAYMDRQEEEIVDLTKELLELRGILAKPTKAKKNAATKRSRTG